MVPTVATILARAIGAVADADIIALQEVERFWKRTNEDDQPALIAQMLPQHHWVYGPAFDVDASYRGLDGRIVNRRRQFGTMLLSRLPIAWSRLHLLPMRRTVNRLNTQNAALECLIRTPCGPIRFFSIHLAHIGADERLEEIDYLLDRHLRSEVAGPPWSGDDDESERSWTNGEPEPDCPLAAIWMGDFNSEHGSAEYKRIAGDNPYHPDTAYFAGFCDAAILAGQRPQDLHTHVKELDGKPLRRRLDYCFVGSMFARRLKIHRIDHDAVGSDHAPVRVEIDLETPDAVKGRSAE